MTHCRFAFRVNKVEIDLSLRPQRDASIEVVVIHPVLGEFFLDGSELVEARDIKLTAALNIHPHGAGWKKITLAQAITMLLGVSRPACNGIQDVPIAEA